MPGREILLVKIYNSEYGRTRTYSAFSKREFDFGVMSADGHSGLAWRSVTSRLILIDFVYSEIL